MARRSEGLKLERRESGLFYARFTFAGQRYHVPTGERDIGAAQAAAARFYEAIVSGRWAPGQRKAAKRAPSTPFDEVAARWLAHIKPSIEEKTFRLYRDTYVKSHFASFFKTIEQLTTVGAQDYIAARLRKVTRPSGRTPAATCARCRRSRRLDVACWARPSRTRARETR